MDDRLDGSFYFCTGYSRLNPVTKPDSYPLPWMDDCVDGAGLLAATQILAGRHKDRQRGGPIIQILTFRQHGGPIIHKE